VDWIEIDLINMIFIVMGSTATPTSAPRSGADPLLPFRAALPARPPADSKAVLSAGAFFRPPLPFVAGPSAMPEIDTPAPASSSVTVTLAPIVREGGPIAALTVRKPKAAICAAPS
jgi:hypothetical protein